MGSTNTGTAAAGASPRRRRADAERSIARIVAAAREELGRNPAASVDDVARAAGVGRMTLYGHFRSRAELIEAALAAALASGDEVLSTVDLAGDAPEAIERLLTASWTLVAESEGLLTAADGVVDAETLRQLHDRPAERMTALLRRGRADGVFRTDLPLTWLTSAVYILVKGAAGEVRAGRLDAGEAPRVVSASVLGLLSPPDPG